MDLARDGAWTGVGVGGDAMYIFKGPAIEQQQLFVCQPPAHHNVSFNTECAQQRPVQGWLPEVSLATPHQSS